MVKNILLIFLFINNLAFSFEWPLKNKIVTATFGEKRWDHFHKGIDIGGGEQEVFPADEGEIIFYYEEGSFSSLPSGLGNFVVLEHQRGLRTLYAHLKGDSIKKEKIKLTKDDVFGVTGNSGGSLGTHLHFEVIDSELNEIVNPLLLLPPLKDKMRSTIVSVGLMDEEERYVAKNGRLIVSSGMKSVYVETYDRSPWVDYFCPIAPFEIICFFNGQKILNHKYEKLIFNDDEIVLNRNDNKPSEDYYLDDWTVLLGNINIVEKQNTMKIIVKDINGNVSSKTVYINIEE